MCTCARTHTHTYTRVIAVRFFFAVVTFLLSLRERAFFAVVTWARFFLTSSRGPRFCVCRRCWGAFERGQGSLTHWLPGPAQTQQKENTAKKTWVPWYYTFTHTPKMHMQHPGTYTHGDVIVYTFIHTHKYRYNIVQYAHMHEIAYVYVHVEVYMGTYVLIKRMFVSVCVYVCVCLSATYIRICIYPRV